MTVELRIDLEEGLSDQLLAELAEAGFSAFAYEDGALCAWGPPEAWRGASRTSIEGWVGRRVPGTPIEVSEVPDENWNAVWEASIEPVRAGPFVVLPSWAALAAEHEGLIPLRVDPKMSFGTGHHASTRLALALLAPRVSAGGRVLDVGTGTGVLAIGALLLGAGAAIGCDIDEWSVPNARECAALNGLSHRFEVRLGDLGVVTETGFDLVVANIISGVLVPILPALTDKMSGGGTLVMAGILSTERGRVVAAAESCGLRPVDEATEGEWWAGAWTR